MSGKSVLMDGWMDGWMEGYRPLGESPRSSPAGHVTDSLSHRPPLGMLRQERCAPAAHGH